MTNKNIVKEYLYIIKEFINTQRRLISRRGGVRSHIKLTAVFHEIGRDPYVKKARDKE